MYITVLQRTVQCDTVLYCTAQVLCQALGLTLLYYTIMSSTVQSSSA